MDRKQKDKQLRSKVVPLVKVWWEKHSGDEATWTREDDMRQYLELFEEGMTDLPTSFATPIQP